MRPETRRPSRDTAGFVRPEVIAVARLLVINETSTRAEIAEALAHMKHRAAREMPVVGTPEHPTPWDLLHAELDGLLTDYERAH